MKVLDRYLIRELILPFVIGSFSIVLMFYVNMYMYYAKTASLSNVPALAVIQAIVYQTPQFLSLTLPASCSLACALAMSRLARESELTAFRIGGASIFRVLLPFAFAGALVSVGAFFVTTKLQPIGDSLAQQRNMEIGIAASGITASTNVPLKFQEKYAMFLGSIEKLSGTSMKVKDVILVDYVDRKQFRVITASRASYKDDIWTFEDAYERVFEGVDMTQFKPRKSFKVREQFLPSLLGVNASPSPVTPTALRLEIQVLKRSGLDSRAKEIQLYQMASLPAACFVMSFVSPIFAILFARSGSFAGVLLSTMMCMLYFNIHVASGNILDKVHVVPTWLCAWLPVIIFSAAGVLAIRSLE